MSYTIILGLITVELHLPGVSSLKEKRGTVKSLLARLPKEFNVAVAEVGHQDVWQSSAIAVVTVTTSRPQADQLVDRILQWIERSYPDVDVVAETVEIL